MQSLFSENYELRKKQVFKGLSTEEERKLDRNIIALDEEFNKKHVIDIKTAQMNQEIKVVAIRNIAFEVRPVKQNIFQKLLKKEKHINYDLVFEHPEDLQYDYYTYEFALSVRDFMKENGVGNQWNNILPPGMDMEYEFVLDESEVEWYKKLPNPQWCLQMLTDVKGLEEKALKHSEEMHHSVVWLKERWAEGYQIYIDYTEMSWLPVD